MGADRNWASLNCHRRPCQFEVHSQHDLSSLHYLQSSPAWKCTCCSSTTVTASFNLGNLILSTGNQYQCQQLHSEIEMEYYLQLLRHSFRLFMGRNSSQHSSEIRQFPTKIFQALNDNGLYAHHPRGSDLLGSKTMVGSSEYREETSWCAIFSLGSLNG